jgi:hypothetical protein
MTKESPKEFVIDAWGSKLEEAMSDVLSGLQVAKASEDDYMIEKNIFSCRILFYNSVVHGIFKEYLKSCGWKIEQKSA